jgi:hypothetical protein
MQLSEVQNIFLQWGVVGLIISLLMICPILYGRGLQTVTRNLDKVGHL